MKITNILSIIFCCCVYFSCNSTNESTVSNQEVAAEPATINWMTIEEAESAMKTNPKGGMYVMVHANWCEKCAEFEATTYKNEKVIADINKFFHPVKLNAQHPYDLVYQGETYSNPNYNPERGLEQQNSYHELLFKIEAKSIPCVVFIDENFEIQGTEMGYKEAEDLRSYLHMYK